MSAKIFNGIWHLPGGITEYIKTLTGILKKIKKEKPKPHQPFMCSGLYFNDAVNRSLLMLHFKPKFIFESALPLLA